MIQEKILSAITSAIGHLKNSTRPFSKKDDEEMSYMIWQASSDVEYCLFLFSLLHSNEPEDFPLKRRPSSKQTEAESALASALNMLKEAKRSAESDDLAKAHEKTWKARNYLFTVLKISEKNRKLDAERSFTHA